MSDAQLDPEAEPIRTAESTVAAYLWDEWRTSATTAFDRARRTATAVAVAVGVVVGAAGLAWLPGSAKLSVALYAPLVAWAAWSSTRAWTARRRLRRPIEGVRSLVVPMLVDTVDVETLVLLLRRGGALVTAHSTVIVEQRRDSLVALVASQYDVSHVPLNIPTGGTGP
jgi:hypothetical protein